MQIRYNNPTDNIQVLGTVANKYKHKRITIIIHTTSKALPVRMLAAVALEDFTRRDE